MSIYIYQKSHIKYKLIVKVCIKFIVSIELSSFSHLICLLRILKERGIGRLSSTHFDVAAS